MGSNFEFTKYLYKSGKIKNTFSKVSPESDIEPTHVIIPYDEFMEYFMNNSKNEIELNNARNELNRVKSNYSEYYNETHNKIAKYDEILEQRDSYASELVNVSNENIQLNKLNSSLIRSAKEKANIDKGLHPKKQYPGYSIRKSILIEYPYKDGSNMRRTQIYKTTMTTPYLVTINRNDALELVKKDLLEGTNTHPAILGILGCKKYYNERYEDVLKIKDFDKDTSVFNIQLVINSQPKYWECEINHVNPIMEIPVELSYIVKNKLK